MPIFLVVKAKIGARIMKRTEAVATAGNLVNRPSINRVKIATTKNKHSTQKVKNN